MNIPDIMPIATCSGSLTHCHDISRRLMIQRLSVKSSKSKMNSLVLEKFWSLFLR